jgi:hypothetical protein
VPETTQKEEIFNNPKVCDILVHLYEPWDEIEQPPTKISKTTEENSEREKAKIFKESVYVSKGLLSAKSGKFKNQFMHWSDANKKEFDVVEDSVPLFK